MRGSLLLVLLLVLLLAAVIVCAAGAGPASARTAPGVACQPVTAATVTGPSTPLYPGTPALLTGKILSGSLPVTYTWAFGDGGDPVGGVTLSPTFTVTHSYTTAGVYTVALTAWNTCTLTPLTATARPTVTAHPCLTLTGLSLVYTPTQVYTYTPVLFNAEVVTGSLPVSYTWAFGDGSPPISGTAATPLLTATHTFTAPGVYTPTLLAWNACTLAPTQRALTLTVAPCEAITEVVVDYWPTAPRTGQVITFTAHVSGGSPPLSLAWAFGDGEVAAGTMVTHVYTQPLTYTLVLTATTPCNRRVVTELLGIAPPLRLAFLPWVGKDYVAPAWPAHLGYGANVASADHAISLTVMGFDWAKGFVTWANAGSGPDYDWTNVDNQLGEFAPQVSHILLRVNGPPPPGVGMPPVSPGDLAAFHDFVLALAAHVSDTWRVQGLETAAYEIWNEPNLDYEWGGTPSAAQYTALLQQGYLGLKAGDPEAIVVSAGLATTGGSVFDLALARRLYGAIEVAPDLTFLRNMYLNGAKGYFDALGSHPYGGPDAPDTPPGAASGPIYFRRAEEQRQVMLDYGDDSPLWATEFGWVLETACDLGEYEWMEVSAAQQAEYLAGAYAYADEHWPWMGPMFLFNLDFGVVFWYAECDPMRWYSITYREDPYDPGSGPVLARPAFHALREMPKYSAW